MTEYRLDVEDQIVASLRRIIRAVDLHSRKLLDSHGLTGPQLATLRETERLGPVSSGALARALNLSQPTVTGIVTRLEKQGFLERLRNETDRRTVTVNLTDRGQGILETAPSLLQDRFRQALARLEDWEQHLVLSTLQRIATMMDAETLEASPHLITNPEVLDDAAQTPQKQDND